MGCCDSGRDIYAVPDSALDGGGDYVVEGLRFSARMAMYQVFKQTHKSRKIKYACCHDGRNYYFMDAFFRKPSVHDIYRNGISADGMTGRVQFAPMGGGGKTLCPSECRTQGRCGPSATSLAGMSCRAAS